jgi:spore coat polysaccharide biosynthesis protein SpsF
MHVVAVIQARTRSTRLPGKVLYPLAGRHVLEHDVERLRTADRVDEVVVATSTAAPDDAVADAAERAGAAVHRGSETDVLGRMLGAARAHDADTVIRATADDALVSPALADELAARIDSGADYAANTIERTFPQGLVLEACSMDSFETVEARSSEPHQREHVTQYYLEHPEAFATENVVWEAVYDWTPALGRGEVRLALDEPADYDLLRRIYDGVAPDDRGIVPLQEAIAFVARAGLADLNGHVDQTTVQGDE